MLRTDIVTKLSLYDWARIMGIDPLHFAQITLQDETANCQQQYFQYGWMDADRVSRETISQAIYEAEGHIEQALGYRLCPAWEVDEWQPGPRPYNASHFNHTQTDVRGLPLAVHTDWRHFIRGGIEARTLLAADQEIIWDDGHPWKIGTVTATVPVGTVECEVEIYYPEKAGAAEWQIRPAKVVISGTTATITFRRELVVQEELVDIRHPAPVDGDHDPNFLEEVDVYRHWNDPQTQVSYLWEGGACGCGIAGCTSCEFTTQTGCLNPRDPRNGIVFMRAADWDAVNEIFTSPSSVVSREPTLVRLYYQAGFRDKRKDCTLDMDEQLKRIVAYYAAALLDRPPCDCNPDIWSYWRQDLGASVAGEGIDLFSITERNLDNPFGTRRGMINAWRQIQAEGRMVGRAVNA